MSLLPLLLLGVLCNVAHGRVKVCTSHEMKNAVLQACILQKRSIRFGASSLLDEAYKGSGFPSRTHYSGSEYEPLPYRTNNRQPSDGLARAIMDIVAKYETGEEPYRTDDTDQPSESKDGSSVPGGMYYPPLYRSKRSAMDNGGNELERVMRKCCYEGCPVEWFISLCM